jgi:hypothetical protein
VVVLTSLTERSLDDSDVEEMVQLATKISTPIRASRRTGHSVSDHRCAQLRTCLRTDSVTSVPTDTYNRNTRKEISDYRTAHCE